MRDPINRTTTEPLDIPYFWLAKDIAPTARRRVAGGIILNHDLTQIILVKSHYSNKWGIPKGGVESHETDIDGALREIYEECGLVIESPELDAMAPCITYRGVRIFLFCYNDLEQSNLKLRPIDTTEISDCAWFSLESIKMRMGSDLDENQNKLPTISTQFLEEFPEIDLYTTLLRDLINERLDAIKRKILLNIDNYQVINGKLIINTMLANILKDFRLKSVRHINVIHDIDSRFPTVFYLPELIRILESSAA